MDLVHRTDDQNGSVGELVLFGELQAVGDHRVVNSGRVKRFKRFPAKTHCIQFAFALGIFGAALVELLGLSGSAGEYVKAKAALGAHVAKPLVFCRQGAKEEAELRRICANMQCLAEHGRIGDTLRRKAREQTHLPRAAQRIEELCAEAGFPRVPNIRSKHLGAQTAHTAVDAQNLAADPWIVEQGEPGMREFSHLTHSLEGVALCGSRGAGFVAQKLRS